MNLTTLIASQLADSALPDPFGEHAARADGASANDVAPPPGAAAAKAAPPVFQLARLPLALTPADYANPRGPGNPGGTLTTLAAFRQLVDPVPAFTEYYSPQGTSTESIYRNLVYGATSASSYTRMVLASAQTTFAVSAFSPLDGNPGEWRPVYATPPDWYDTSQSARFMSMDLDVSAEAGDHPYTVLGGGAPAQALSWKIGADAASAATVPLHSTTTLQGVQLRYLQVNLTRPWLNFELFSLKDWTLAGQGSGYVSTGSTEENDGVLPLLPVSLIVGIDTTVTADLGAADRALLDSAGAANQFVSLGPFVLQTGAEPAGGAPRLAGTPTAVSAAPETLYVVGWFSSLVPLAPVPAA